MSTIGLPQAGRLFSARLDVKVEWARSGVKFTPADIVICGVYDAFACERGMDVFPEDARIEWFHIGVSSEFFWKPTWAFIRLSRNEILAKAGAGYIFIDPETATAFLDVERCQGHEDVFPLRMAFEKDNAAGNRLREFLEPGDCTPFRPPGARDHDGIYRGYLIEWQD